MIIKLAETYEEKKACFPVMAELRPHLSEREFLEALSRMEKASGYNMAFLSDRSEIAAVGGFKILENLSWGRYLHLDDLVTAEASRSLGFGEALFNWLLEYARREGCRQFHLESGVQRFRAHQFYLNKKMIISCHHFALEL